MWEAIVVQRLGIAHILHCDWLILLQPAWTYWVEAVAQLVCVLHHHFLLVLILSLILQLNVVVPCVLIYIFQFCWACLFQASWRHVLHELHMRNVSGTTKRWFLRTIWLLTLKRQFSIIGLAEKLIAAILIEHHRLGVLITNLRFLPSLITLYWTLEILTCAYYIFWWVQLVDTSFHSCFTWFSWFASWWFFQVAFVTIFI